MPSYKGNCQLEGATESKAKTKRTSSIVALSQLPADRLHQISIQDRLIIFFQFDCVKIVPDVVPVLANVIVNQSFVFGIVLAIKVKR